MWFKTAPSLSFQTFFPFPFSLQTSLCFLLLSTDLSLGNHIQVSLDTYIDFVHNNFEIVVFLYPWLQFSPKLYFWPELWNSIPEIYQFNIVLLLPTVDALASFFIIYQHEVLILNDLFSLTTASSQFSFAPEVSSMNRWVSPFFKCLLLFYCPYCH